MHSCKQNLKLNPQELKNTSFAATQLSCGLPKLMPFIAPSGAMRLSRGILVCPRKIIAEMGETWGFTPSCCWWALRHMLHVYIAIQIYVYVYCILYTPYIDIYDHTLKYSNLYVTVCRSICTLTKALPNTRNFHPFLTETYFKLDEA